MGTISGAREVVNSNGASRYWTTLADVLAVVLNENMMKICLRVIMWVMTMAGLTI